MFEYGKVYKIDPIKLAKERCKFSNGGNGNYKDYINYNRFDSEIFTKWNTFMYKSCRNEHCIIELECGYFTIPYKIVTEV